MADYIISDLHLGHENIIKYCDRPFKSVDEMNNYIINQWNSVVSDEDTVYFLGDLSLREYSKWLLLLKGNIIFIQGNHDKPFFDKYLKSGWKSDRVTLVPTSLKIDDVLFIHNPDHIKRAGWVVHGHVHNKAPFISYQKKRINVSAEALDYTPVSLDEIFELIDLEYI
jgi:calcineurin-like phosphoesterase family protein